MHPLSRDLTRSEREVSTSQKCDPVFTPLLPALRDGVESAQRAFCKRFITPIRCAVAWQMGSISSEEQEDVIWDILFRFLENGAAKLHRYDPERGMSELGWIKMQTRGSISNAMRKVKRRRSHEIPFPKDEAGREIDVSDPAEAAQTQLERLVEKEAGERALHALDARMTPALRATFQALYVDKMAPEEATHHLGCTPAALRRRRADLYRLMREILAALDA